MVSLSANSKEQNGWEVNLCAFYVTIKRTAPKHNSAVYLIESHLKYLLSLTFLKSLAQAIFIYGLGTGENITEEVVPNGTANML